MGVVCCTVNRRAGTQLTMRTFHTGGVRQLREDITKGFRELSSYLKFANPKVAILAEVDGTLLEIREMNGKKKLIIAVEGKDGEEEKFLITYRHRRTCSCLLQREQQ